MKSTTVVERVMKSKFQGWDYATNLHVHTGGRILVVWDTSKVELQVVDCCSQTINCKVKCKVTHVSFNVSFVYGLYSNSTRKRM